MVSPKVTPQLPKPDIKVKEKIVKTEVVDEHIKKIQDLQSYKQHDDKISTLLCETTNKVGTLKTCEEIIGFNDDEDVKGFNCELEMDFKCVHDLYVRDLDYGGIHVVETKVNAVRDWSSHKTLPEVRNNKVANVFQEEDELEYDEPLDEKAKQVTYVVQRTLCSPKIGRIKKGLALKVIKICKVPLAMGKHYNELVTCDVVDMETCHVLLGRPWQRDVDSTHQGKSNTYLFKWCGKTIAMLSLSVVSPKMKLENKTLATLATLVASPKDFQAERKKTEVSYALVMKVVNDFMENAIPAVIKLLLAEFSKIVKDDTLDALPPLRNIQYQIDLSRNTTLLVSISSEVLDFNSIKELYAIDEDFGNIRMELETKQHRGEFLLLDGYLFKGTLLSNPKSQIFVTKDCDDRSRPEEQHLVVPCYDEEIVKFPTQHATTEISRDNGSNLEDFLIVLTR
nr:transposon Ty3-I Gag-Pol polyprotein [Tanacetum cinerariifolium]